MFPILKIIVNTEHELMTTHVGFGQQNVTSQYAAIWYTWIMSCHSNYFSLQQTKSCFAVMIDKSSSKTIIPNMVDFTYVQVNNMLLW